MPTNRWPERPKDRPGDMSPVERFGAIPPLEVSGEWNPHPLSRSRRRSTRVPVHPGKILQERFLDPLGLTQQDLARKLGISRRRVNELIQGHRGITPDTAIRLAVFFGIDAQLWMGLQVQRDMHLAWRSFSGPDTPEL